MVTIGIIGSGSTADVHRDRYEGIRDVEVVAVPSTDGPDQVRELRGAIDAVDVCSPASTHREGIETALDSGLPVLCTPPMGGEVDDAAALSDAATEGNGTLFVGHVSRFDPGHVGVRASVLEGAVGEPGVIRISRSVPTKRPNEWHDWYADDGETGDLLLDFALHDFDFLRWLIGDVERVYTRFRDGGAVEHAVTFLRFSNGAVAHVETMRGSLPELRYRVEMDIAGDDGLVQYDTATAAAFERVDSDGSTVVPYAEPPLTDGNGKDGYYYLLDHFRSCVDGDQQPDTTADDAVTSLGVAVAARRSVELGRPVSVAEVVP